VWSILKDRIKVGIIGSGFIADHHCHAYSLIPDVDIIGISSLKLDEAKNLMRKYAIKGETLKNYQDLLKLGCDAISVCLPNFLHRDVTISVLESGAHALVEKPLARNIREGDEMLDAERSSKRKIFYCENNIYSPTFSKVKQIVDEGALGDIYMGRGKEQHSGPHSSWFYKQQESGGGALLDLGIHDIACLTWYLDRDVKEVFCQTRTIMEDRGKFGKCEVEDNAVGMLYFDNGAQIVIEESWTAPGGYDMRFELFGTQGQIKASPTFSNLINVYSEKGHRYAVEKAATTQGWTFPVPAETWNFGYPQEVAHFINCIKFDKNPLTSGEFGQNILRVVETMYKSARSKKVEEVSL
jgi:myo-inositol 2-dehydrogenase/D-chiro-inositol 1-dehydrogenase